MPPKRGSASGTPSILPHTTPTSSPAQPRKLQQAADVAAQATLRAAATRLSEAISSPAARPNQVHDSPLDVFQRGPVVRGSSATTSTDIDELQPPKRSRAHTQTATSAMTDGRATSFSSPPTPNQASDHIARASSSPSTDCVTGSCRDRTTMDTGRSLAGQWSSNANGSRSCSPTSPSKKRGLAAAISLPRASQADCVPRRPWIRPSYPGSLPKNPSSPRFVMGTHGNSNDDDSCRRSRRRGTDGISQHATTSNNPTTININVTTHNEPTVRPNLRRVRSRKRDLWISDSDDGEESKLSSGATRASRRIRPLEDEQEREEMEDLASRMRNSGLSTQPGMPPPPPRKVRFAKTNLDARAKYQLDEAIQAIRACYQHAYQRIQALEALVKMNVELREKSTLGSTDDADQYAYTIRLLKQAIQEEKARAARKRRLEAGEGEGEHDG